jgi:hypothetical protein
MTLRTMSLIALLAVACGGENPGRPTPPQPDRLVVIFADVTSSLTDEQVKSVEAQVKQIITSLPLHTVVHVFSVGRDTETAKEVMVDASPVDETTTAKNKLDEWRATLATSVQEALEQLYKHRKETEPGTLSSCITTALRRTASLAIRSTRQVDVFIVSDMIEECGTSLLGGRVSLMKPDIAPEIQRANDLTKQPVDLRRATITLVRPQYNVITKAQSNEPSAADLEIFWRALLAHCNTDQKRVFFGADVPPSEELFSTATVGAPATSKTR